MPHCGLEGPIDIDGSFWLAVDAEQPADPLVFDSATGTFKLLDAQTGLFTAGDGTAVKLSRIQVQLEFGRCE